MNFCIRCNPISELLTTEDGELSCRFHDKNYLLETRPDPVVEPVVETVTYSDGTEATGVAPLPLASPVDTEAGE